MFSTISGFSDAAGFRIYDNVPYYYMEGDTYLAKFKTGLNLEDVIEFNSMCDSFSTIKLETPIYETPVTKVANTCAAVDITYTPCVKPTKSTKSKKTKKHMVDAKSKKHFMRKNIQKYRNKLRDEKRKYMESEMGGAYCSLEQHYEELELHKKKMQIKSYYKNNVLTKIIGKVTIFEWKRKLRVWSSNRPTYYFEKDGILYYYYYANGVLQVYGAFMKMDHLANMYPPPTTLFTELIIQKNYIHVRSDLTRFPDYETEDIYEDQEDLYEDQSDIDYSDMMEYYADF